MTVKRILLLTLLASFLTSYLYAMPLSPESLEHLRATGQLETVLERMADAHARGVDAPGENILRSMRELRRDDNNEVTLRVPVILVDFQDNEANEDDYPVEHFEDMLFSLDEYETGSMREWYRENSYGEVDVIGEVVGWVRLEEEYGYYVGDRNGLGAWPNNSQRMTWEAVQAVDDDVDFSEFDNDDDGRLDALFIVHAGPGAEANGGDENMIWSHAWGLNDHRLRLDGITIQGYNTVPDDGQIGVFGHELGHNLFGLPDTYDRDYTSSGLGSWCMMAGGSWNGEVPGTSPAHFSLPLKAFLDFVNVNPVRENMFDIAIDPVVDEGATYLFMADRDGELFMAENRQQIGFDAALPGSGLVIYHVDENVDTQNDNEWYPDIEEEDGHYLYAVIQADGNWDLEMNENRGDAGDPYPFERNDSFNGDSAPNSNLYSGDATGIAINNIVVNDGVVTCDLLIEEDRRVPEIHISPRAIETDEVGEHVIEITNIGQLPLEWRADMGEREVPGWISWAPEGGVLEPDEMDELFITLDSEGLDAGEYETVLNIRSNDRENNDVAVSITFIVNEILERHFEGWAETEISHSIIVRDLTLDGERVPSGWDIGVFTPGNAIAGGELWDEDEGAGIAAWGSEDDIDQFDDGEVMSFRVWDPETETESSTDVTEIVLGGLEWRADGLTVLELAANVVRSPWSNDDFVETDANHSILVSMLTFEDEPCPSGWDIAVFAPHPDGEMTIAGRETWNADDGSGIAAWAAADEAPDQFEDGDPITYMVWDFEADMVYTARATVIAGADVWEADGFSVVTLNVSLAPPDHEIIIGLRQGWNIMSINVILGLDFYENEDDEGPSVVLMMEQLRVDDDNHHVFLMKNQSGNFYVPSIPFNNIPHYDVRQGYQVKVDADVDVTYTAPPIDADADIPLRAGWNIVAYFPQYELDMSSPDFYGISPIVEQVMLMKNSRGQFAVPSIPFSNMADLTEGQGYQIRLTEDVVLNYPPQQEQVAVAIRSEVDLHWAEPVTSDRNMSVLINSVIGLDSREYQVAAINAEGDIVGVGTSSSDRRCGIAIWGDDESTDIVEGLSNGEAFELRLWDAEVERELGVNVTTVSGSTQFEADAFTLLDLTVEPDVPQEFYLAQAYPNPFNATTKLSYGLPESGMLTMRVYDLTGRLVATLYDAEQQAGYHTASWHSGNAPSGMYLVRMESAQFSSSVKVMLLR